MSNFELLVRDRPIDNYYHEGKTWVEGRKGTEYKIRFYNNSYIRQKIVVSVDGLNVMTGDNTWDRGYVVDPHEAIVIPGWRKDKDSTAAFVFSSMKGSYNQQNDSGDARNLGVIGCMVFAERLNLQLTPRVWRDPPRHNHYHYHYDYSPKFVSGGVVSGMPVTITPTWASSAGASGGVGNVMGSVRGMSSGAEFMQNSVACANKSSDDAGVYVASSGFGGVEASMSEQSSPLGTGYGRDKEFHTKTVYHDFYDSPSETLAIYYDDRRGLESRGIIIKPTKHYTQPQAFPGYNPDGCPPPKKKCRCGGNCRCSR